MQANRVVTSPRQTNGKKVCEFIFVFSENECVGSMGSFRRPTKNVGKNHSRKRSNIEDEVLERGVGSRASFNKPADVDQ